MTDPAATLARLRELGIETQKTVEYGLLPFMASRTLTKVRADDMRYELLAIIDGLLDRAEKAEAELSEIDGDETRNCWGMYKYQRERAEKAEADLAAEREKRCRTCGASECDDIERLKVCGTCANTTLYWDYLMCKKGPFERTGPEGPCMSSFITISDKCHFKPSRWTPYWE